MSQAFPTHAGQLLAIMASCGAEGRELVLDSEDCMAIAGHVRSLTISREKLADAEKRIAELETELSERDAELRKATADCQANLEAAEKAGAELEKRVKDYLAQPACCHEIDCGCRGVTIAEEIVGMEMCTKLGKLEAERDALRKALERVISAVDEAGLPLNVGVGLACNEAEAALEAAARREGGAL